VTWLVTGANGFIGSRLTRTLVAAGHSVRGGVLPGAPTDTIDHLPIELVPLDVTRPATLAPAVERVTTVVHLAALLRDFGPAGPLLRVNADGTRDLLAAAAAAGVRRFVLVSSLAVHAYRDHRDADEDTLRDGGALPYGRSKIAAEDHVRRAHAEGRLEGVVVRPGMVPFGPRDRLTFPPLARALARGVVPLVGGGRARFTTAYVENLADGLLLSGTHPAAAGATFLLTDGQPVSWREYFAAIAAALECAPPRLRLPAALVKPAAALVEAAWDHLPLPGEPPLTRYRARLLTRDLVFRSDRARRVLGYEPTVGLAEGLRRTVAWYRRVEAGDPDADRGDP
jgi:nucleoside-diphosphate-sugar epimerase